MAYSTFVAVFFFASELEWLFLFELCCASWSQGMLNNKFFIILAQTNRDIYLNHEPGLTKLISIIKHITRSRGSKKHYIILYYIILYMCEVERKAFLG